MIDDSASPRRPRAGFTLIEILITIAVLGIATVLVIPSMGQTGVLKVQTAVRQVVADITFAQSDAMAYQEKRLLWFNSVYDEGSLPWTFDAGNGYVVAGVVGAELDLATDALIDPDDPNRPYARSFDGPKYGGALLGAADFDGDELLVFDELGGPVADFAGDAPSDGGSIECGTDAWRYRISVAPMTGRVTVERIDEDAD